MINDVLHRCPNGSKKEKKHDRVISDHAFVFSEKNLFLVLRGCAVLRIRFFFRAFFFRAFYFRRFLLLRVLKVGGTDAEKHRAETEPHNADRRFIREKGNHSGEIEQNRGTVTQDAFFPGRTHFPTVFHDRHRLSLKK